MKQRFSSLDVRVIAHELSGRLVSLRLANIYDLSSRIFLLKFAKPDHREQLLIDSGFRCHLTEFARATAAAPSQFVARLRKFLRTRRVTKVQQVGTDRVIEIQFSDGLYRLFLEFYAGGNVVLTDADLTILGLLRTVSEGAEHEQYKLGLKYDLSLRQNYAGVPELTKERVRDGLQRAIERQQEEAQKPGKKIKKKGGDALRKALAVTTTEFPPVLLDHALHVTGYDRNAQPEEVLASEELLEKLLGSLQEAQRVVQEITSAEMAKGYIIAKQGKASQQDDEQETGHQNLLYDDFHPFKPAHLATDSTITFLEYDGFNKTADEFFSSLEGQKLESRLQEREDTARRKLDHARQEQAIRLDGLDSVQELNVRKAVAIEANIERVEEALAAVNGLVAQGMDWVDIGRLIEKEQGRHNAVAQMIKLPLKLHENTVTLSLTEYDALEEEEEMADVTDNEASDSDDDVNTTATSVRKNAKPESKQLAIDIDLALSPWVNARQYYDQKRTAAEKKERTAQASQKALKSTEQKVMADLKKGLKQEKEVLRPVRKQMWFEKFVYFISSDGYLVLAGRDAQQNEILYRRYLKKGDVYVHADLHGAASVIIKNNPATPEAPIPPSTLGQAGHLAVCTSSAWESKAVMSAWWVHGEQVSKTAPTGEYLSAEGFMVRGKKNFLPPAQLLLGFGLLWRISEESKGRHVKNRFREVDAGVDGKVADRGAGKDGESPQHEGGEGHEEDDEDDEFPDAKGAVDHEGEDDDDFPDASMRGDIVADHDDDDDDDHFPDAQLTDGEGSVRDADGDHEHRSNPLQSNGNVPASTSQEEHDEEEDEDGTDSEAGDEADDKHTDTQESEQKTAPDAASTFSTTQSDASASSTQDAATPKSITPSTSNQPTTPKPAPPVRGKRGKAKKAAQKYANQDDADRQLAMKLLGSQTASERDQASTASQTAKTESVEEARLRRREQHQKAQRAGLEAEEIRRLNLEEGVETLDEDEVSASAEYLSVLESLVAAPLPGDEILEVIPVCAPWSALAKYKYKAKLQPGQQKKGKAVREILGRWVKDGGDGKKVDAKSEDRERIWPREVELVRGMREVEVVGVIPVKSVRVMMGSGGGGGGDGAARGKKGGARGGKGSKRSR
ncbi:hypothetical protein LTR12_006887 [Friedmanniomyces endolithicus]|nr:hypothetical protein LTR12_006887 [Friedmanniomyces endolithicus]